MMLPLYLAFILATTILILLPGPNVALIVANSVAYGARYGLLTVVGTSSAMVVQLFLTVLGMSAFLGSLAICFNYLRWLGVAYLAYLGIRHFFAPPVDLTHTKPQPKSPRAIFLRGFFVSLTNPKTLFFYGAFFPQFLTPSANMLPQLLLLSVTFLVIAILLDSTWSLLAAWLRSLLAMRGRLRNRLTGGTLLAASFGLALARKR